LLEEGTDYRPCVVLGDLIGIFILEEVAHVVHLWCLVPFKKFSIIILRNYKGFLNQRGFFNWENRKNEEQDFF